VRREAYCFLMVTCLRAMHRQGVHFGQRVAASPTPNPTFREATTWMKLGEGRHRVTTQVKVWSPEINHRFGSRACSLRRRQHWVSRYGRGWRSPTGSESVTRCYKEAV
jgi:hypothetical protein